MKICRNINTSNLICMRNIKINLKLLNKDFYSHSAYSYHRLDLCVQLLVIHSVNRLVLLLHESFEYAYYIHLMFSFSNMCMIECFLESFNYHHDSLKDEKILKYCSSSE